MQAAWRQALWTRLCLCLRWHSAGTSCLTLYPAVWALMGCLCLMRDWQSGRRHRAHGTERRIRGTGQLQISRESSRGRDGRCWSAGVVESETSPSKVPADGTAAGRPRKEWGGQKLQAGSPREREEARTGLQTDRRAGLERAEAEGRCRVSRGGATGRDAGGGRRWVGWWILTPGASGWPRWAGREALGAASEPVTSRPVWYRTVRPDRPLPYDDLDARSQRGI